MRSWGSWVVVLLLVVPAVAQAQVRRSRDLTTYKPERSEKLDYANAEGLPVPQSIVSADQTVAFRAFAAARVGASGFVNGSPGSGSSSPYATSVPVRSESSLGPAIANTLDVIPQESGGTGHVFATARADLMSSATSWVATNKYYPYRASGKLFFKANGSTWTCSGALVKPGLVVTAAHCVAPFGSKQFYTGWEFIPGYRNGSAPYGTWTAFQVFVKSSWFDGTDPCVVAGVLCENDVAIILLKPKSGNYPGKQTGWYGYYYGGAGFNNGQSDGSHAQITQIGYPTCLDNGIYMQRNDSQGFVYGPYVNNTIIGSLMCGGSSGGPLLVNFGIRPALTGTGDGSWTDSNAIVGVTSWGYADYNLKQQGASPFTADNIQWLITSACGVQPKAC